MTISIEGIEIKHLEHLDNDDKRFDAVSFDIFGRHSDEPEESLLLGQLKAKSLKRSSAIEFSSALLHDFLFHEQSKLRDICEAIDITSICAEGKDVVMIEMLAADPRFLHDGIARALIERAITYFTQTMDSPYFAVSALPEDVTRYQQYPPQYAPFITVPLSIEHPEFAQRLSLNYAFFNYFGFILKMNDIFVLNPDQKIKVVTV